MVLYKKNMMLKLRLINIVSSKMHLFIKILQNLILHVNKWR
jgi:hypothetical protein